MVHEINSTMVFIETSDSIFSLVRQLISSKLFGKHLMNTQVALFLC